VYAAYDQVFFSENDSAAKEVDPGQNEELKAYVQTLADYAKDSNAIGLVLLGESKIMLNVSQEYMAFAKENELRYLVDFGWLRNAFVADYIANELTNNGFTNGFIASVDGFTRNLDNRANAYSLNVFNKNQNSVELAAVMEYSAPKSLAFLRGYPMYDQENYRYYSFANGRIVTAMIDPEDGQSKVATDNLVSYSESLCCGELALSVMPVYVSDTFSEQALNELTNEGIYSVWFNDKQLMYNQQGLKLTVNDPYYTK
jgi:hypothetical protein